MKNKMKPKIKPKMKTKAGKIFFTKIQKLKTSKDFCQCKHCKSERYEIMLKTLEASIEYFKSLEIKLLINFSKEYLNKPNKK